MADAATAAAYEKAFCEEMDAVPAGLDDVIKHFDFVLVKHEDGSNNLMTRAEAVAIGVNVDGPGRM